jgi:hypothetical protein
MSWCEIAVAIADCGLRIVPSEVEGRISFPEDIRPDNTNCREQNRKNRREAMLAEASSPREGTG